MNNDLQLTFEFMKESRPASLKKKGSKKQKHIIPDTNERDSKRAAIAWLLKSKPSGLGCTVPTRIIKFKAGIAAFWSKSETKKGKKTLFPFRTAIVEVRTKYDDCITECGNNSDMKDLLLKEKMKKNELEAQIRISEPELKLTDNLFSDIESWDYRRTTNSNYAKCCLKIEKLERALNKGSRFERIRQSLLADYLYLAVPAGMTTPQELADGWGLLYINEDLSVDLISQPENWNCPLENKLHLVQNIAKSNIPTICFANGLTFNKNGSSKFLRVPRKRRS